MKTGRREGLGPAWIGIGAQRSGTTWFTDLLCAHPQVCLGANGRKEQHAFNRSLLAGWSEEDTDAYRCQFSFDPGLRPGEFTPFTSGDCGYRRPCVRPPRRHCCWCCCEIRWPGSNPQCACA